MLGWTVAALHFELHVTAAQPISPVTDLRRLSVAAPPTLGPSCHSSVADLVWILIAPLLCSVPDPEAVLSQLRSGLKDAGLDCNVIYRWALPWLFWGDAR